MRYFALQFVRILWDSQGCIYMHCIAVKCSRSRLVSLVFYASHLLTYISAALRGFSLYVSCSLLLSSNVTFCPVHIACCCRFLAEFLPNSCGLFPKTDFFGKDSATRVQQGCSGYVSGMAVFCKSFFC